MVPEEPADVRRGGDVEMSWWNWRRKPEAWVCPNRDIEMVLRSGDTLHVEYTVNVHGHQFLFRTEIIFKDNNRVIYRNIGWTGGY